MAVLTCGREELWLRRVPGVCAGVVIRLMAAETGSRQRGVVVVYVAVCTFARRHHVRSGQRECGVVVVERRIRPRHRVMAHGARCREACRGVRGIIGRCVILLVAGVTRCAIQRVIVVDMTIGTLPRRHSVGSSQRESGAVVVEGRIQPGSRVVTRSAGLREIRSCVIRIRRILVILQVTRHASGAVQVVVVVHVAIRALPRRHGVHSRQREGGQRMVKRGIRP